MRGTTMDRLSSPGKSALALLITEELESDHEAHVRRHLAEQLAGVLGLRFTGVRHGRQLDETDIYVIPAATPVTPQPGIRSVPDLSGAEVARPVLVRKC